jgi:hypothetical protein
VGPRDDLNVTVKRKNLPFQDSRPIIRKQQKGTDTAKMCFLRVVAEVTF